MQKIATRIFITASILFGILGIILVLTGTDPGTGDNLFMQIIAKLFLVSIFVVLSSFALSIAGKYLKK